jgi:CheY-like chemotaxis protein
MPPSHGQRTRILVVDDEPAIAITLSAILEREGYSTLTAFAPSSAIDAARSFRPDCLISDVFMPEMNGVEVAIGITEMLPNCKVILMSGEAASLDVEEASAKGFPFPLLSKPVPPVDLLRKLAELLSERPLDVAGQDDTEPLSERRPLANSPLQVYDSRAGLGLFGALREKPMVKKETERRRSQRFSKELPVSVKTQEGEEQKCATKDISAGGLFFYCDIEFAQGSPVEFVLVLPAEITGVEKQWVCCHAKVVRVETDSTGAQRGVAAKVERFQFLPEMTV